MGLDMYLKGKKYNFGPRETEDGFEVSERTLDIGYWRKHPNLHGFIVEKFAGGEDECQEIELSRENVLEIIEAVKSKNLPDTTGFFFGTSTGCDDEISRDVSILTKALEWLTISEENVWRYLVYQASW